MGRPRGSGRRSGIDHAAVVAALAAAPAGGGFVPPPYGSMTAPNSAAGAQSQVAGGGDAATAGGRPAAPGPKRPVISTANVPRALGRLLEGDDSAPLALLRAAAAEAQLLRLVMAPPPPPSSSSASVAAPLLPVLQRAADVAAVLEPRATALVRPLATSKNALPAHLGARPLRSAPPGNVAHLAMALDLAPEAGVPLPPGAIIGAGSTGASPSWRVPISLDLAALTRARTAKRAAGAGAASGSGAAGGEDDSSDSDSDGDSDAGAAGATAAATVSFLWDPYDASVTPTQYAALLLAEREVPPSTIVAPVNAVTGKPGPSTTALAAVAAAITAQLLAFCERAAPNRGAIIKTLAGALVAAAPALRVAALAGASAPAAAAAGGSQRQQQLAAVSVRLPGLMGLLTPPTARQRVLPPGDDGTGPAAVVTVPAATAAAGKKRRRAVDDADGYGGVSESKGGDDADDGGSSAAAADIPVVSVTELLFARAQTATGAGAGSAAPAGGGSGGARLRVPGSLPLGVVGTLLLAPPQAASAAVAAATDGRHAPTAGLTEALPSWAPRVHPAAVVAAWLAAAPVDLAAVPLAALIGGGGSAAALPGGLSAAAPAAAAGAGAGASSSGSSGGAGVAPPDAGVVRIDVDVTLPGGKRIAATDLRLDMASVAALAPTTAPSGASAASTSAPATIDGLVDELAAEVLRQAYGKRPAADVRTAARGPLAQALHAAVNDAVAAIAAGAPDATAITHWLRTVAKSPPPSATAATAPAAASEGASAAAK